RTTWADWRSMCLIMKPLKSTERAKELVVELWRTREFVRRGERHFVGDRRYDLQFISDGFASCIDDSDGDPALFERICASYQKATDQEQSAQEIYRVTPWWQERRHGNLKPVIAALLNGDISALRKMYINFYRDPCSPGLVI